ncbi:hypothetical protein M2105_003847 [Paenibacillus sp. PastF-1]|nr:hypothetical protein [Paenibacillus sp. PastF-2]MDF9849311.1 hypothetical protein [Paenibacillus sp. PastM-2]MDF9855981.1 hypothetical protein [Paenibacillus sp. PastF-1]MDH6481152.1 hypothetical protein [Paenibacillus sp. PastH-2]MDH6508573.1 hypothetical protein [Paenibacillus sp. PastM-3]
MYRILWCKLGTNTQLILGRTHLRCSLFYAVVFLNDLRGSGVLVEQGSFRLLRREAYHN